MAIFLWKTSEVRDYKLKIPFDIFQPPALYMQLDAWQCQA